MSKPTFKKHDHIDKKTRNTLHHAVYKTICSVCQKPCEVPFKPNGKKPVFCDACFSHTKEPVVGGYKRQKDKTIFDTPENFVASAYTGKPHEQSVEIKIADVKRELASANAKLDKLIDLFNKLK